MLEDESQVVIHQLSGIVVKTVVPGVLPWLNQLRLFLPSAFVADAVPLSVISPYFDVDGLARVIYTWSTGCNLVTLTTVIKTPVCWISSTKGSGSIVYFFEYNYIYTHLLLPLHVVHIFLMAWLQSCRSNPGAHDIGDAKYFLK